MQHFFSQWHRLYIIIFWKAPVSLPVRTQLLCLMRKINCNIVKQLYDTLSTPEEPRTLYTVLSFTHSCTHDDGEAHCSHSWPRGSWEKWGCHVISATGFSLGTPALSHSPKTWLSSWSVCLNSPWVWECACPCLFVPFVSVLPWDGLETSPEWLPLSPPDPSQSW